MKGRRVLVSGAGTGVGYGVALTFVRRGADVVFHYSHSADGAEAGAEEARQAGVRATAIQADFTDVDDVRKLAREAEEFLGGVDILVNNAGITTNLPFEKVTVEQYDTLYHVNIRAMFFLTQALTGGMAERGEGIVINVSSVHAYAGFVEHSIYAGTKGAIVAFTRTLSLELIQKGIRVNCIAPGWVEVPNHLKADPNMDLEAGAKSIPAGFIGQPDDVGELAVFLASPASRYMVGQTVVLDGGQLAIMPLVGDFRTPSTGKFGIGYVPGVGE